MLDGPGVLGEHCVLENLAGTVTLIPHKGARCSVNGSVVTSPCQLTQGKNSESLIRLHRVVSRNSFTHSYETTAHVYVCVSSQQHTRGMNGGSTGQIPSTKCFEWQRPCSKPQASPVNWLIWATGLKRASRTKPGTWTTAPLNMSC